MLNFLIAIAYAAEPALRPLSWLDGPCDDPRYPQLAGDWAVGCSPAGVVDRAVHLGDGRRVELSEAARSPGLAPGALYAPGRDGGLWLLPDGAPTDDVIFMPYAGVAPPGFDGALAAVSMEDEIQWFALDQPRRLHIEAAPLPWYPPAIAEGWIAWVQRGPDGSEDVWLYDVDAREPRAVAAGPEHERHPAIQGGWLGWIAESEVVLMSLETGEVRRHPADARVSRRLSLWSGIACWESLGPEGVDVVCSDGARIGGRGDQRGPSRWGSTVLYVDAGRTFVATLPEAPTSALDGATP